jgi:hypothetical protein
LLQSTYFSKKGSLEYPYTPNPLRKREKKVCIASSRLPSTYSQRGKRGKKKKETSTVERSTIMKLEYRSASQGTVHASRSTSGLHVTREHGSRFTCESSNLQQPSSLCVPVPLLTAANEEEGYTKNIPSEGKLSDKHLLIQPSDVGISACLPACPPCDPPPCLGCVCSGFSSDADHVGLRLCSKKLSIFLKNKNLLCVSKARLFTLLSLVVLP